MSKLVTFMLAIYVVAIAGAFFIDGKDGKPIASMEKTKNLALGKLDFIKDVVDIDYDSVQSDIVDSGSAGVYRWKSENGAWVYGDSPPNTNTAELVMIDTQANILASNKPARAEHDNTASPNTKGLANIPVLGTVEATKDIKKQISELKKQIQARESQMR